MRQACCIAAFCVGRSAGSVAVGLGNASVQLFRAQDIVQEKPYPVTLTLEDGASSNQEVTSIKFLDQGFRVVLFACTRQSVCSWRVWEGGNVTSQEIRMLNLDAAGGALPMCSCPFPGMNALLVAKPDAVFAYDPDEGNMSAMPLDGQKVLLEQFKSYFVVVTKDDATPSFTAGPSSMPKQTELTSSRLHANRFFFTAQEDEDPEIVREKARRVRALGLEPPRSAHFRQFARRQGLMTDVVEQAQTDVVVPRQSSPSGASRSDGSTEKRDTSNEDEAK
eukprot:s1285_g23.t1